MVFLWMVMMLFSCATYAQEGNVDSAMAIADTPVIESGEQVVEENYEDTEVTNEVTVEDTTVFRTVADSTAMRLKKLEEFAYANDAAYWKKKAEAERTSSSSRKGFWDHFFDFFDAGIVRMLFYGLLIALFLFVIYRVIVVNNLYLTPRSRKLLALDETAGDTELDDEGLAERIRQAITEKDYRLAVRYHYLKTLRSLDDKGWIRYHAQATNHDYMKQVNQHGVAGEFRLLTQVYEYVWYGEFALSEEQFNLVQQHFQNYYHKLSA